MNDLSARLGTISVDSSDARRLAAWRTEALEGRVDRIDAAPVLFV